MPLSLDVGVVRARIPALRHTLYLPSLPPQGDAAAWLENAARLLKRQNAPRLLGAVTVLIRLEDAHPRRSGAGCIAPVLALLLKAQVLQSDRAHAVRRLGIEWAPIRGVEIHFSRGT
jgi:hypothetical protein